MPTGGAGTGLVCFRLPGERLHGRQRAPVATLPRRLPARLQVRSCKSEPVRSPNGNCVWSLRCCLDRHLAVMMHTCSAWDSGAARFCGNCHCEGVRVSRSAECIYLLQACGLGDSGAVPPNGRHQIRLHLHRWQGAPVEISATTHLPSLTSFHICVWALHTAASRCLSSQPAAPAS